jgi:chromosome segregation ATPase
MKTILSLTVLSKVQDDRFQELRETHKLEIESLSEELRKMKMHLHETEALFEAAQRATSNVEETVGKKREEISRLEKELEQSKNLAKEEEEKRVKAITLLKTVRQKLVKAEKDKEDVTKEMASIKEREKGDKDREQTEKLTLLRELEVSRSAHAQEMAALRAQFEKDLGATRERQEQEISALKGQYELDLITLKVTVFALRTFDH